MRDAFSGIPIRSVMQTNFTALSTSNVLGDAVKATLDGAQHEFPVMWGDTVMGILTKANLLAGLSEPLLSGYKPNRFNWLPESTKGWRKNNCYRVVVSIS